MPFPDGRWASTWEGTSEINDSGRAGRHRGVSCQRTNPHGGPTASATTAAARPMSSASALSADVGSRTDTGSGQTGRSTRMLVKANPWSSGQDQGPSGSSIDHFGWCRSPFGNEQSLMNRHGRDVAAVVARLLDFQPSHDSRAMGCPAQRSAKPWDGRQFVRDAESEQPGAFQRITRRRIDQAIHSLAALLTSPSMRGSRGMGRNLRSRGGRHRANSLPS